jgi:hypothetical protein
MSALESGHLGNCVYRAQAYGPDAPEWSAAADRPRAGAFARHETVSPLLLFLAYTLPNPSSFMTIPMRQQAIRECEKRCDRTRRAARPLVFSEYLWEYLCGPEFARTWQTRPKAGPKGHAERMAEWRGNGGMKPMRSNEREEGSG